MFSHEIQKASCGRGGGNELGGREGGESVIKIHYVRKYVINKRKKNCQLKREKKEKGKEIEKKRKKKRKKRKRVFCVTQLDNKVYHCGELKITEA